MKFIDRKNGWLGLALLVPMVAGCASGPSQEEMALAQKDQEIQMVTTLLNEEKSKVIEIQQENEVAQAKLAAQDETIDALKEGLAAKDITISEQERRANAAQENAAVQRALAEDARRRVAVSSSPPATYGRESSKGTAAADLSGKGKYHLRVIALPKNEPGEESAQEIAQFLTAQEMAEVVARMSGNHWVVDIGNFASMKSSEATSLKERVQGLKFQGVRQFKDAYFVTY